MDHPTQAIALNCVPSKALLRLLHGCHALAIVCLPLLSIDPTPRALLILLILLGWWQAVWSYRKKSIRQIEWRGDGSWHVTGPEAILTAFPTPSSVFLTGWLTIVGFRLSGWRWRYLVLLPDNCDQEGYRQLRARLQAMRQDKDTAQTLGR